MISSKVAEPEKTQQLNKKQDAKLKHGPIEV